jgi:hypothetical protein
LACDYEPNVITFSTVFSNYSLPSDVVLPPAPDSVYSKVIDTVICSGWDHGITLKPKTSTSDYVYEWNNSSIDSTLTVSDSGVYWVAYNNGCHYKIDTFVLHGSDLNPVITINVFDLSTTIAYRTYQWMMDGHIIANATNSTYAVSQNGEYQVIVGNEYGCKDTSAIYVVTNYTAIDNISKVAPYIKILPNPAHDRVYIQSPIPINIILTNMEGRELLWQSDTKSIDISSLAIGMYMLQITDSDNKPLKKVKLFKWR